MSDKKISRRDFIKLAGLGATTAVLTGCGPASRYVTREPYTQMPEYTYNGESTFYATTCTECAAACGLIIRTMQGRAIKVEGNPNHPLNLGKTCARGQATLHGLYNPDRVQFPLKQERKTSLSNEQITWEEAIAVVSDAFNRYQPEEIAFLLGEAPDHLFDFVTDLTRVLGAPAPLRFGALSMFETRATLQLAAQNLFGNSSLLHFDLSAADVVFSFGANILETWLNPVANTRGYAQMRKGTLTGKRGHLVQFEARMSQTGASADEWIPIIPGSESHIALALGRLVAEIKGNTMPAAFEDVDLEAASNATGISFETLERLAAVLADAEAPLVIPGSPAMAQTNGLQTAESILALNIFLNNQTKSGGLYFTPAPAVGQSRQTATVAEISRLIQRMKSSEVKALFIHGVNPLFELPRSFGFAPALENTPLVVSFSSFPDETALASDYIFPDHTGLESWGYQHPLTGTQKSTLSGLQPVVSPFYDTRATVDVLLAAVKTLGGKFAEGLPFDDEVAFVQNKLSDLLAQPSELIRAGDIKTFSAQFQQYGGWWSADNAQSIPSSAGSIPTLKAQPPEYAGEGEFFLVPFVSPTLAEKGANKPWLQELPDPTTTVMWNTWVEINPETAAELGIQDDDVVRIISDQGEIEASVYRYPAIRPDTIAIPFGQGHTAYGRYAAGRGANPLDLVKPDTNLAGDLVFANMRVKIEKTGKRQQLARLESRIGVYGEH